MITKQDLEYAYSRGFDAGVEAGRKQEILRIQILEEKRYNIVNEAESIAAKAEQRDKK